jgi:RNA polymerase-binding transcription factor DksA
MRDEEQVRYRERLISLQSRLKHEAREAMDRLADTVGKPDEISHLPIHPADRDTDGLDRDMALEANREQMLDAIDTALTRIDEGSYGRCDVCGREISKTRLDILPFATRCVVCERKHGEK